MVLAKSFEFDDVFAVFALAVLMLFIVGVVLTRHALRLRFCMVSLTGYFPGGMYFYNVKSGGHICSHIFTGLCSYGVRKLRR